MKLVADETFIFTKEKYLNLTYKVYLYTPTLNLSFKYYLLTESKNNISKIFHTDSSRELDDNLIKYLLGIDL